MTTRYIAHQNNMGTCKHSFALPDPLIIPISDLRLGIVLRHAVERFMPGKQWSLQEIASWCSDRNIAVYRVYGEVYLEAHLLADEYATAKIFPMPWIALRFATADDAMLFKLSWPH